MLVEELGCKDGRSAFLHLKYSNRHGIVTGATGTGKTITLSKLVESFASNGVSVFIPDVKGDLTGLAEPAQHSQNLLDVLHKRGIEPPEPQANKTLFWTVFPDESGLPISASVSDLGALMMSNILELNANQSSVLELIFLIANDELFELSTLDDLLDLIRLVSLNNRDLKEHYGTIHKATLSVIMRKILTLQAETGGSFFGEGPFDIEHLLKRGVINILHAIELIKKPRLYATVVVYLLRQLYENLPEQGDSTKPKLAFFFDEAHLLFTGNKALEQTIENTVRLIRSKGVAVFFVTQAPNDVPDNVLTQLNNRIQHRLTANTVKTQRELRAAATTMPRNPNFDNSDALQSLEIGEALVSLLNEQGQPAMSERIYVFPPASKLGVASNETILSCVENSSLYNDYYKVVDDSSYSRDGWSGQDKSKERASEESFLRQMLEWAGIIIIVVLILFFSL